MQKSLTSILDARLRKARTKARFARFLHENYGSAERVAVAFGVRYQTACNWLDEVNCASGDAVNQAWIEHPEEMRRVMAEDS